MPVSYKRAVSVIGCLALIFNLVSPVLVLADDATPSATIAPDSTPASTPTDDSSASSSASLASSSPTPDVSASPDATPAPADDQSTASSSATPVDSPEPVEDPSITFNNVVVGQTYVAPFDSKVTVTFDKLPDNPGALTIKKVSTGSLSGVNPLTDTAYDVSSDMENGTFDYTLTLPTPTTQDVQVKTSEDGSNFVTVGGVSPTGDTLTITGINHFSIFVVTSSAAVDCPTGAYVAGVCYSTIQAAISAASLSLTDTINVEPGLYAGPIIIDRSVNLIATSSATIAGQITLNSAGIKVSGFTVNNPTGNFGILINGYGNSEVSNNTINNVGTGAVSGNVYGVYFQDKNTSDADSIKIQNNIISNIGTSSNGSNGGIGIGDSTGTSNLTGVIISGNTISNILASSSKGAYGMILNHASHSGGSNSGSTSGAQITNNTISLLTGRWAHGIGLEGATPNAVLTGNTLSSLTAQGGDVAGVRLETNPGANTITFSGNTLDAKPLSVSNSSVFVNSALGVLSTSGNVYQEVFIGGTYYYYGLNAFSTIQSAVTGVSNGGTVSVAAGTYTEGITITKALTLTGANIDVPAGNFPSQRASESIINGGILINTNNPVEVNGFKIQNGATLFGSGSVGGITIAGSGHTIKNNILVGNNSSCAYPAIHQSSGNNLVIDNNEMYNWCQGIYLNPSSGHTISNNNIHNNVVGIGSSGIGNTTITSNTFTNNTTEAIGADTVGLNVLVNRNIFESNAAGVDWYPGTANSIDATENYWGSTNPSFASLTSGSVTSSPWYINPERSILSTSVSDGTVDATGGNLNLGGTVTGQAGLPSGVTSITLSDTSSLDLSAGASSAGTSISVGGSPVDLTQSQTVGDQSVAITQSVKLQSGTASQPVVITNNSVSNVTLSIPDATTILGPAGWDGTIQPPTVVSASGAAPSGFSVGGTVIEVGSPGNTLLFDSPVSVVLTGVTGTVGYKPAGSTNWVQITNVCGGTYASPAAPAFPGECYISNGTDTTIYTYHLTTFASLIAATPTSSSNNSSSGSSGSSSGNSVPSCNDAAPGGAPTLISATPTGPNQITLTWTKAADPVTGYVVTYGLVSGLQQYGNPGIGGGSTTSYIVQSLSGGTTYYFRVRASNGCNGGSYSNEISAVATGGVINTPAAGFEPNVLGASTSTNDSSKTTQEDNSQTGEVEGASASAEISAKSSASPAPAQLSSFDNKAVLGVIGAIIILGTGAFLWDKKNRKPKIY